VPREATDERDSKDDASGGRQIVLMRQAQHLHEIGHRAFAAVVLPVGVGDEAHRRVEGEVRCDGRLFGWIERQNSLHAHQHIENEKGADVEQ
jgi:hypothetical protein